MEKELKIHPNGLGLYSLKGSNDLSDKHRFIKFEETETFHVGDALYSMIDKVEHRAENMIVVEEIKKDGLVVRRADRGLIRDLRPFSEGEEFTIIAQFL